MALEGSHYGHVYKQMKRRDDRLSNYHLHFLFSICVMLMVFRLEKKINLRYLKSNEMSINFSSINKYVKNARSLTL